MGAVVLGRLPTADGVRPGVEGPAAHDDVRSELGHLVLLEHEVYQSVELGEGLHHTLDEQQVWRVQEEKCDVKDATLIAGEAIIVIILAPDERSSANGGLAGLKDGSSC